MKNMLKKTLCLILALTAVLVFAGCQKKEDTAVNVGILKGPTGMGTAYLMEQSASAKTENSYNFTVAGAPDILTAQLISGEIDIAALPTNAISTLYNKTGGKISVLGINTLGVLYILDQSGEVESLSDLDGKTVLASGKGSTAELVLDYLLSENGVSAEIIWAAEHSEAVTLAIKEGYDIVMLPEPFVTSLADFSSVLYENGFAHKVKIDLAEEWKKLTGCELAMGGIAVRTEFLEDHPNEVKAFVKEYGESVAYVSESVTEAAKLIEKYEIADAKVAEKALPRCNIVWISDESYPDMLKKFLTVIYEKNPSAVGGNMPNEDFYKVIEK